MICVLPQFLLFPISREVIVHFEMFSSIMEHKILNKFNAALVVNVKWSRKIANYSQFCE